MIKEEYLLVELAAILGDDIEAAWEKVRPSLYEKLDVSSFKKVIDCLQQMLPRGKKNKNELVMDGPSCGPLPSRMSSCDGLHIILINPQDLNDLHFKGPAKKRRRSEVKVGESW